MSAPVELTAFERTALTALAETLFPAGGEIPESAPELGVVERIEGWLQRLPPQTTKLVRAMIAGYEITPLASRHLCRFSRLGPAEREAWVSASPDANRARKEALIGLRTLVSIAFSSAPAVVGRIGSEVRPVKAVTVPPPAPSLPVRTWPDARPGSETVDVVIVGSGAGGAVAAAVLAGAGLSVAVVEEGPSANHTDFGGEVMDRLLRFYRDGGLTTTIGTPLISLPMGRAVGGTTVVNSGTCFRTPEWVLAEWSALGIPGVGAGDLAAVFEEVEDILGVTPVPDDVLGPNGEITRRGIEELGWSGGPIPRNAPNCHGHGVCGFGCPIDAKAAMHVSYLPRAAAAGAVVTAHAKAQRILVEGGRAAGVVVRLSDPASGDHRGELTIRARATVVAAGAVFTPALLLRQKLANSSGQVGRNLHIHPGMGVTGLFDEDLHAWRGVMQSYYVDEKLRDGILLEATFPPPGLGYSAGALPGVGRTQKDLVARYPQMASMGAILSDRSAGRVRPLGSGTPLVTYRVGEADVPKAVEAIAMSCEIFLAAGAKKVFPMLPGVAEVTGRDDVARIRETRWRAKDLKLSAYHPMSSCRMGSDPAASVVDPWGETHDVRDLHVMDASILPSSTAVNPQETIMALVTRCARRLADRLT